MVAMCAYAPPPTNKLPCGPGGCLQEKTDPAAQFIPRNILGGQISDGLHHIRRRTLRLRTDSTLRQALYGLYLALFGAKEACPKDFHSGRLTTILTAVMGVEDFGWRVVGITEEALKLLASVDFDKNKLPRKLCRGHLVDRSQTTKVLFDRQVPALADQFFEVFLKNDETVIMLNEQNKAMCPSFIPFDNPNAEFFPNGSLMGWKHRKKERDFLRELHSKRKSAVL